MATETEIREALNRLRAAVDTLEAVATMPPPTPTLRDQFAMAVVGGPEGGHYRETDKEWAARIYARADSLLAARSAPASKKEG